LVTADGVEVLTARFEDSPGGPVPMPEPKAAEGAGVEVQNGKPSEEKTSEQNGTNGKATEEEKKE